MRHQLIISNAWAAHFRAQRRQSVVAAAAEAGVCLWCLG